MQSCKPINLFEPDLTTCETQCKKHTVDSAGGAARDAHPNTHTRTRLHTHTHTCTCTRTRTDMHKHTHARTH